VPDPLFDEGKIVTTRVKMAYGLPAKVALLSDDSEEIDGYYPAPALSVSAPSNTLLLSTSSGQITLPVALDDAPTILADLLALLASGSPFPPIYVEVTERLFTPGAAPLELGVFSGFVTVCERNPDGKSGVVRLDVRSEKNVPENLVLGLPIDATCRLTFGVPQCGFNLTAAKQTGVIDLNPLGATPGGYIVKVPGLTVPSVDDEPDAFYFRSGLIQFDDLGIKIRDWSLDEPDLFSMARKPPAYWHGRTVSVFPGCLRDKAACARHGRTISFNGLGIGIPDYDPFSQLRPRD
jgi:hypothetical protein